MKGISSLHYQNGLTQVNRLLEIFNGNKNVTYDQGHGGELQPTRDENYFTTENRITTNGMQIMSQVVNIDNGSRKLNYKPP